MPAGIRTGVYTAVPSESVSARVKLIAELANVTLILLQFALIIMVLRELDILNTTFRRVLTIAAVGFAVNYFLPTLVRLRFFVLLSLATALLVLGTPASWDALWDPSLGLPRFALVALVAAVLIGICYLPIAFWPCVGSLAIAGATIALFRSGVAGGDAWAVIWPVLAAMFMFRLIIFVYDMYTMKERPSPLHAVAYFFMIPNVCFTLFPIIDFKAFVANYYNEAPLKIYNRGIRWMGWGAIHLVLYRLVDKFFSLPVAKVEDGTDLVQFVVSNACLYLNVSGHFHLIVGLLLLFGFNLPRTNRHYFLASSFTDYWRRANIYWKDFMMKVFYYPAYFRLRKRGPVQALVLATAWVFLVTWFLHLYQTWWLKNAAQISWPDTIFWTTLGLLVLGNSYLEMFHGRKRKLAGGSYSLADAGALMLRTGITFVIISVLWSLWVSDSLSTWLNAWSHADLYTAAWGFAVIATIMIAKLVVEILPHNLQAARKHEPPSEAGPTLMQRAHINNVLPLLLVLLLATPSVQAQLDNRSMQSVYDVLAAGDALSVIDRDNYYQQLSSAGDGDREYWEMLMRGKIMRAYRGPSPGRDTGDFRWREAVPDLDTYAYDAPFATNRWSMRDRYYPLSAAPGTVRIAVLGSSHVMGWGIEKEQVFESIIERRLNEEYDAPNGKVNFEVLNFAYNGVGILGQVSMLEARVRDFSPDIVMLVMHQNDMRWLSRDLLRSIRDGLELPAPELYDYLEQARINRYTPKPLAFDRLAPHSDALLSWTYAEIARLSRDMGAVPVSVALPIPNHFPLLDEVVSEMQRLVMVSGSSGHITIDLTQVYDGYQSELLQPSVEHDWEHINEQAHALVAEALYTALTTDERIDLQGHAWRAEREANQIAQHQTTSAR